MVHTWLRGSLLALLALTDVAGNTLPEELVNGGMESLDADGKLAGWRVREALLEAGYKIGPESGEVFQGKGAARLDSRAVTPGSNTFGSLSQSLDAAPYRGKRVRYRAAVKMAEAKTGGQAQLWLRVDLAAPGGASPMGFFDNMGNRPIQSTEWKTYEIVGDVAPDAQKIALGVLTIGPCLVFADEATLEIVGKDVAPTGGSDLQAPTQPFFTRWLVLPLVGLALFALGFLAPGRIGKFAFEFTLVYWTLYALPTLVSSLVPVWGGALYSAYESGPVDTVVRWAAANVLGIKGELVSAIGNGSGDSTYSYVQALVMFVLALAAAVIWSLVDRRATDHARLKGFLRSALRYYLAVYMLSYGLGKLGTLNNQFPAPGLGRLASTYGASSPMGILWTFMGSSRAYTAFAGASEVAGGVLLLWRRSALLGALVCMGVMIHVMVLNFCYDVPVKLFSFHLVVAAACIALPDAKRLVHFFLGVGSGAASTLAAPFSGRRGKWIYRAVKTYLIVMVLVLVVFQYWRTERAASAVLPAVGEWKLAKLEADGRTIAPKTGEVEWLTLRPQLAQEDGRWTATSYVATLVGGSSTNGKATLTSDSLTLTGTDASRSLLVPGDFSWRVVDAELHLDTPTLHATFTPAARDFLLMRRGFRWINEHPFNR